MKKPHDETGNKYHWVTAIAISHKDSKGKYHWFFRCDCGKIFTARITDVRSGQQKSCGCYRVVAQAAQFTKHGHATNWNKGPTDPTYTAWHNMHERCRNPNYTNYELWGGRGITVCERWKDFVWFLADMGERPGPGFSLERRDNNGNYEPNNCKWATATEQNNNRHNVNPLRHSSYECEAFASPADGQLPSNEKQNN